MNIEDISSDLEPVDMAHAVGPRIAIARENAGLSREALARRVGVEVGSLVSWETGEREPRANRLMMLSGILDVSLGWLLEGRESEHMATDGNATIDSLRNELEHLRGALADASATVDSALSRLEGIETRIERGEADEI